MRNPKRTAVSITPPPIIIETVEKHLDRLADIIDKAGSQGAVYLPIYERLEVELEKLKAKDALMARVQARLKR
jgi:hypothetical protein